MLKIVKISFIVNAKSLSSDFFSDRYDTNDDTYINVSLANKWMRKKYLLAVIKF